MVVLYPPYFVIKTIKCHKYFYGSEYYGLIDNIVTLPVFNVVSLFFTRANAHWALLKLFQTCRLSEKPYHTSLTGLHATLELTLKWFGVHLVLLFLNLPSLSFNPITGFLPFFSIMFSMYTSPSSHLRSDTASLIHPLCVEELFWMNFPLAGSVWFLPLDKTQKPGTNPMVQPKLSTKSASMMTRLRVTSLNRINQLWCEIEMRVGGKVRKEDEGEGMEKEKMLRK